MNYRRMGQTGLKLSEIAFGAFITFGDQIDDETASKLLHRAYEQGVNFFDNADAYAKGKAEVVMGSAIKDLQRETLVLSSKVFWPTTPGPNGEGLSRKHIMESCHASLRRLGTEYLDLYFCHRFDPDSPLDEVVHAMDDLVHQGKVLYWGTSVWEGRQISAAHAIARERGLYPPMVEQPEYSLFVRSVVEQDLGPVVRDLGVGLVSWSPLRNGLLSGKYSQGIPDGARLSLDRYYWLREVLTEASLQKVQLLAALASELGMSLPQLAIAWVLRSPLIASVITGATKISQLDENLKAGEMIARLTPEILLRIEEVIGIESPSEE